VISIAVSAFIQRAYASAHTSRLWRWYNTSNSARRSDGEDADRGAGEVGNPGDRRRAAVVFVVTFFIRPRFTLGHGLVAVGIPCIARNTTACREDDPTPPF
jgi:hypothetical protein